MRAFRFYAILLALLLCGCAPAFAQFGFVSNLTIKGGFTPGYTTENDPGVTNGTIRWNPAVTALQVRVGAGWTNLAAGIISGMGGSYSQTPWTSNVSGAWFNLADVAYGTFSNILVHNDLTVGDHLTAGTATMGGTVINGDLTVNGTLTRVTEVTITTNVYVNTGTTYVHTVVYDTQTVYQTTVVFTNLVTTNQVDTFVNIGGSFTMGAGSTFNATGATTVIFPYFSAVAGAGVAATGVWNLVDAQAYVANPTGGTQVANYQTTTDLIHQAVSGLSFGTGNGNLVITNTGSPGQIPYHTAGNTGYWANAAGESVLKNIASYTYTGGETSVSISFAPLYNPITVSLTGDYVGDGRTNNQSSQSIFYGVRLNSKTNGYRATFVFDSYSDVYPASAFNPTYVTGYMVLQAVPGTNNAAVSNFGQMYLASAASWTFLASPHGVSCFGSGYSISINGQEYGTFLQTGQLATNDYVNRNFITQMVFASYGSTNGVQYVAKSNATIRIWGMTQ